MFDAAKAVDPLDYDFTTASFWKRVEQAHPELKKQGKGRVPDPTDGEVADFRAKFAAIFGLTTDEMNAGGLKAMTENLQKELDEATDEERKASAEERLEAIYQTVAAFCSGSPSPELLRAVPGRYFFAFLGWLFGQILPLADITLPPRTRREQVAQNGASS